MPLKTDDLDQLFANGTIPEMDEIHFSKNAEEYRLQIWKDIQATGFSMSQFADECSLHHSHLYDFLNNKKQLSRDRLLVVFLNLHYDYSRICQLLRHFHQLQLYPREERDYLIMAGIQRKWSVDEINQELERNHFINLCPEKCRKNQKNIFYPGRNFMKAKRQMEKFSIYPIVHALRKKYVPVLTTAFHEEKKILIRIPSGS